MSKRTVTKLFRPSQAPIAGGLVARLVGVFVSELVGGLIGG
jgi:hypothetical protein